MRSYWSFEFFVCVTLFFAVSFQDFSPFSFLAVLVFFFFFPLKSWSFLLVCLQTHDSCLYFVIKTIQWVIYSRFPGTAVLEFLFCSFSWFLFLCCNFHWLWTYFSVSLTITMIVALESLSPTPAGVCWLSFVLRVDLIFLFLLHQQCWTMPFPSSDTRPPFSIHLLLVDLRCLQDHCFNIFSRVYRYLPEMWLGTLVLKLESWFK